MTLDFAAVLSRWPMFLEGALLTIKKGKDAVATGGQILLAIGLSPLLLAVKGCVAQR